MIITVSIKYTEKYINKAYLTFTFLICSERFSLLSYLSQQTWKVNTINYLFSDEEN